MVLTTIAVVVGLVVGLLRGGRPSALLRVPVAWWLLLPVGVAAQVVAVHTTVPGRFWVLAAALSVLLVWALRNSLRLRGATVLAVGLAANLAVLVANGHVPVRWESLVAVEAFAADEREVVRTDGLYRLESDDSRLELLGAIVPVPGVRDVVSFGDLIVLAGVVTLAANALLVRRRREGLSPEELFGDDPRPAPEPGALPRAAPTSSSTPAVQPVLDLSQPLPDWGARPEPSRSAR
jgi:hypothetical protein